MKTPIFAVLLALAGAGTVQAADIKPGLWEFRSQMNMPGQPDMAAQMARMQEEMKKLPPETRRMMEQQMAARGVAPGDGGAIKVCISPEDAKRTDLYTGRRDGNCRYTDVSQTANSVKGKVVCTDPKASGDFEAQIESPTRFRTKMNMQSAQGSMKSDTDARWLAADCGNLRPAGQ